MIIYYMVFWALNVNTHQKKVQFSKKKNFFYLTKKIKKLNFKNNAYDPHIMNITRNQDNILHKLEVLGFLNI